MIANPLKPITVKTISKPTNWSRHGILTKAGEVNLLSVSIDDDIIVYIHDSLQWISTFNPSTRTPHYGLNYCGITVISQDDELLKLKRIIKAWADLFKNAKAEIELTGSYYTNSGNHKEGGYEKLKYNKIDLLNKFSKLIEIIEMARIEKKSVIHFGI